MMQEICTTRTVIRVIKNTYDDLFYCRWSGNLRCVYDWYLLPLGWSECKMRNAKSPYKFQFLACTLHLCHPLMVFFRWLCCRKQQNIRNDIFSRNVLCKYFLASQNFSIKIFNEHFHLFCSTCNMQKNFSYSKLATIRIF